MGAGLLPNFKDHSKVHQAPGVGDILSTALLLLGLALPGCSGDDTVVPPPAVIEHKVEIFHTPMNIMDAQFLKEISGVASSNITDTIVWMHNDGGGQARAFAVSKTGNFLGEVYFQGSENRDWEDMASVTDRTTGKNYLYIASTGDNKSSYESYFIHRIEEPVPGKYDGGQFSANSEIIEFRYEDILSQNVDAMAINPATMDIYLFSKGLNTCRVYSIKDPFRAGSADIVAEKVGVIGHGLVVSADVNESQLLIKTFSEIICYPFNGNLAASLELVPSALDYVQEPRGEAVCWEKNNKGYFTIGELTTDAPIPILNYYSFGE